MEAQRYFALIFFTAFSFHITFVHFGIRKEKDKEQRKISGEKKQIKLKTAGRYFEYNYFLKCGIK